MRFTFLVPVGILVLLVGVVRAEDTFKPDEEGFIRNWLILAPLPFGDAQNGAEALDKQQVKEEAKLQPKEGDKVKVGDNEVAWKAHKADSRAWTRGLVRGIPAVRVPAGLMTGWVRAVRAAAPSAGLWLIRWAPSRRLLAVKPISFSSGR